MRARRPLFEPVLAVLGAAACLVFPDHVAAGAGAARATAVYEIVPSESGAVVRGPAGSTPGALPRRTLTAWVEAAARSVSAYYGRFPSRVKIFVDETPAGHVGHAVTRGGRPPTIRIALGRATTVEDLERDWVLTHEMVHLAFPSLKAQPWLEEGLATYVEPIARAKAGVAPPRDVWRWLLWGLPKGLPDGRDRGLDSADSWGRTYWGGALFCFLADVEIRRVTHNRRSLGDALRAILDACGGISTRSTIDAVVAAGDAAVGHPVLRQLYDRLGRAPGTVDLPALFRLLGVDGSPGALRFDDAAPYAAIRRSMETDARARTAGEEAEALTRLRPSRSGTVRPQR